MRILHVFDHSVPLHSGYTFRSFQILSEQRKLGIETLQVTGIKHVAPYQEKETVEGFEFFRTFSSEGILSKIPIINQWNVVRDVGEAY